MDDQHSSVDTGQARAEHIDSHEVEPNHPSHEPGGVANLSRRRLLGAAGLWEMFP